MRTLERLKDTRKLELERIDQAFEDLKEALADILREHDFVECDFNNDAILYCIGEYDVIQDWTRGGYYAESSGQSLGNFTEYDDALKAIKDNQEKQGVFNWIIFCNERGDISPILD